MTLAILKTIGVILLTGPILFTQLIGLSGGNHHLQQDLIKNGKRLFVSGAIIYSLSMLLDIVFNSESVTVTFQVLNLFLVPLVLFLIFNFDIFRNKYFTHLVLIIGLVIIILHASSSQSGYEAGIYPYISLIVHLLVTGIWSVGLYLLIYSKLSNSGQENNIEFKELEFQFFIFSIALFMLLLITGAILMVSNVHSIAILDLNEYGTYLNAKLYLTTAIIFLFIFEIIRLKHHSYLTKNETQTSDQNNQQKIPIFSLFKATIILSVIIISGILSNISPPSIAPFFNPQSWQLSIADQNVRIDAQAIAGSTTDVRFEVFLPEPLMELSPSIVNFDLYVPDSDIGVYGEEAIQVSQTSFQGEAIFPIPGQWQLDLSIFMSDGSIQSGHHTFILPAQPLVEDIRTYLSLSSITYNKSNIITFLVGIGLILVYALVTRHSYSKNISSGLAITGITGLSLGIYMLMSVVLVKTYPSTYWKNPQTYSSSTINEGKINFVEHCTECHGESGKGDGPWTLENRGRIPDLGSPHMDVHTDGEIYWWIARGIPTLDMPPLGDEIEEVDRWNIINYVRSLRHGIP